MGQDKLFDKIKARLSGFTSKPDADSWDFIEAELESERKGIGWWMRGVILVASIAALLTFLFWGEEGEKESAIIEEKQIVQEQKDPGKAPEKQPTDLQEALPNSGTLSKDVKSERSANASTSFSNLSSDLLTSSNKDLNGSVINESGSTIESITSIDDVPPSLSPVFFGLNCCLLIPIDAIVQDNDDLMASDTKEVIPDENRNRRIGIYLQAMPTHGYNQVEPNQEDDYLVTNLNTDNQLSVDRIGLRAELGIEYMISRKLQLQLGLLYYNRKQNISYQISVPTENRSVEMSPDGTSLSITPEYQTSDQEINYDVENIGIHMRINYLLSDGKVDQFLGGGLELHQSINNLDEKIKEQGFYGVPTLYTFANLYYRAEFKINKRFAFLAQPTFNYAFYINKDFNAPFYVKPYGFGLNLGFNYKF